METVEMLKVTPEFHISRHQNLNNPKTLTLYSSDMNNKGTLDDEASVYINFIIKEHKQWRCQPPVILFIKRLL